MTRSTGQRLRLLAFIVALSALIGAVYSDLTAPDTIPTMVRLLVGALTGAAISFCVVWLELFGAERLIERGSRNLPLGLAMLVRILVYGGAIVVALLLFPWLINGAAPSVLRPGFFKDVLFSIAATFVMVSLTTIIQLIGPNVLGSLITGRYLQPREEWRIVGFFDLVGSTALAERIGNVRFHALLAETFTPLARKVTDAGGEVHRYVGDAMIATWPIGSEAQNARPIVCLFACQDLLASLEPGLLQRFGHAPGLRAALHLGPLVAGEIGGFKREITLIGDAMNTAARIEQACRQTGEPLLASWPLIERAALPPPFEAASLGSHLLRGKAERIELFALRRRDRPERAIPAASPVACAGGLA